MSNLELAQHLWRNDQPLPLDLTVALLADGIDVGAAEATAHLFEAQLNGDIPYGN